MRRKRFWGGSGREADSEILGPERDALPQRPRRCLLSTAGATHYSVNCMKISWKRRWYWWILCILVALVVCRFGAVHVWGMYRWKTHIWLSSYLGQSNRSEIAPDDEKHLIFVMVDHYEPGRGERGTELNREWLDLFRRISDRNTDHYGNRFRYTWFYPYDEHNEEVLIDLCNAVFDGYGEVELHWHLDRPVDNETFPKLLSDAISWFEKHGALVSSGQGHSPAFAYIAGNWDLDASRENGHYVTRQLDILRDAGCYADFTFSTVGTECQPSKTNSIYYATDSDEPKSHDTGVDARVGRNVNDRLMIFQGPIRYGLHGCKEYGAVELNLIPTRDRIEAWIDTNIHVVGRPEWVFVKVYSHGIQSREDIVQKHLEPMLRDLSQACGQRGIQLHYMSAREAYNVVKAAEDGRTGDPEEYRDFQIPKPLNMLYRTSESGLFMSETDATAGPSAAVQVRE
jgi:hypothetical protein